MGLLEECAHHFGSKCLYEVLGIYKTATASAVKKAYYKLSMLHHPDKATDDEDAKAEATIRFQLVSKVYGILSDKERRAIYDETGAIDEENVLADEDAINAWRKIFKKVTKEDIEKFTQEYQGSKEETDDVAVLYDRFDGDMKMIMDHLMAAEFNDEPRIKDIIDSLIAEEKLRSTKKYKASMSQKKVAGRQKRAAKEAKEAEEQLEKIKQKEGADDLTALILKRQAARNESQNSFFDSLAEKYAPKSKKSKSKM